MTLETSLCPLRVVVVVAREGEPVSMELLPLVGPSVAH